MTFALTNAGTHTISPAASQTLTINGGIFANESATITANIILGAAQSWTTAASKTLSISGGVTNGGHLLTLDGAGNTVISGIIGGAGGMTKSGIGTTTLSGENIYTGVTSVIGGTLLLQHAQALGTGASAVSVSSGATLAFSSSSDTPDFGTKTLTLNGHGSTGQNGALVNVAGNNTYDGDLTKTGTGTWTLYGNGTRTGATSILGGIVNINGDAISETSGTTLGSATLIFSGSGGIGDLTLAANTTDRVVAELFSSLTINDITRNAGATIGFNISGTITSSVTGSGTNRILAYATVTDSIATGLARRTGLGSSGTIVRFDGSSAAILAANTKNAAADCSTRTNSGTLNWTNAGALIDRSVNSLTIDATGNAGQVTDMGVATNVLTLSSLALQFIGSGNGTLTGGQVGATNSGVIIHQHGSGVFTFKSLVSSGTGSLIKLGTGTLILTAANTYTGRTTVNEGTLQLNGSETIGSLAGGGATGGNVNLQGNTLTVGDASNTTYGGVISGTGAGALTKVGAGTLILTAANTYPGATTISAGTLQLGDGTNGNGSLNTASAISVANDATFAVKQTDTVVQGTDFSGAVITGDGNFEQSWPGTTILTGVNIYVGTTTVSDGILLINGNQEGATGAVTVGTVVTLGGTGSIGNLSTGTLIQNGGTLTAGTVANGVPVAGNIGTLTFNGNVTLQSTSSIWLVDLVQGTGVGTGADRINVGGILNLNGTTLEINFGGTFIPNQVYTIASYRTGSTGTFGGLIEGAFVDPGNLYRIHYGTGPSGVITLTAVPEPGTFGLLGLALAGTFFRRHPQTPRRSAEAAKRRSGGSGRGGRGLARKRGALY